MQISELPFEAACLLLHFGGQPGRKATEHQGAKPLDSSTSLLNVVVNAVKDGSLIYDQHRKLLAGERGPDRTTPSENCSLKIVCRSVMEAAILLISSFLTVAPASSCERGTSLNGHLGARLCSISCKS